MNHLTRTLIPAAFASLLLAQGALAQSVGTYVGSTTEGDSVQIVVGDDGSGGSVVTGALVFWTATCTKTGPGRGVAWGIGANSPIVGGKATVELGIAPVYEKFVLTFSGNQVTGTFLGRTAEFVDVNTSTKKVEQCDTGVRQLTATMGAAATKAAHQPAGIGSVSAWPLAR